MSDPFDSPSTSAATDDEPLRPGPLLIGSAVALMLAGVLAASHALQLLIFIRWSGPIWLIPATFGALGLAQVLLAAFVARGQAISVGVAALVSGLQGLIALGWVIYSIVLTLFSPLGLCWLLLSVPPMLLLPLTLPRALRLTRARRDLYRD